MKAFDIIARKAGFSNAWVRTGDWRWRYEAGPRRAAYDAGYDAVVAYRQDGADLPAWAHDLLPAPILTLVLACPPAERNTHDFADALRAAWKALS